MLRFISIMFLIILTGCHNTDSDTSKIKWTSLTMDQAVLKAQKEKLPLFVYWGAEWCPPCNVLKTTTFKDSSFITASHKYISVYLDGDTNEAQSWGDKLKVRGYPTLMVLTPELKEVVRLNAGVSSSDMANTLDIAFQQTTPALMILDSLLQQKEITSTDDNQLQLLANYSWWQDTQVIADKKLYSDKLFQLETKLPPKLEKIKSYFFMTALSLKLNDLKENEMLEEQEKSFYRNRMENILSQEILFKTNLETFFYSSDLIFTKLSTDQNDKSDFINSYLEKLETYRELGVFTMEQDLESYSPLIEELGNKDSTYTLSEIQKEKIKTKFLVLLKSEVDPKKRVNLISTVGYLFFSMGLQNEAEQILLAELKTAISPHYVMSTLGYFEKEKGNIEKALNWYKKAYETSEGPATRLQWHGMYVRSLISLTPNDNIAIKAQLSELIKDNIHMSDAFMGRNLRVLESTKKAILSWSKEHDAEITIKETTTQGKKRCLSSTFGDFYENSCLNYFNSFTL